MISLQDITDPLPALREKNIPGLRASGGLDECGELNPQTISRMGAVVKGVVHPVKRHVVNYLKSLIRM